MFYTIIDLQHNLAEPGCQKHNVSQILSGMKKKQMAQLLKKTHDVHSLGEISGMLTSSKKFVVSLNSINLNFSL